VLRWPHEDVPVAAMPSGRSPGMLRRHEEGGTLGRGLRDIDICQQVAGGGQGAVVPHVGLLLPQSLEDEGDEAIHFCSHAMQLQGKGGGSSQGELKFLRRCV